MYKHDIEHKNDVKMLAVRIQKLEELINDTFIKNIKVREKIWQLEKS